jgi:hypothetical protein
LIGNQIPERAAAAAYLINISPAALVKHVALTGEQIDEIISQAVAARSLEIERERRSDSTQRETSAAEFLKRLESCP